MLQPDRAVDIEIGQVKILAHPAKLPSRFYLASYRPLFWFVLSRSSSPSYLALQKLSWTCPGIRKYCDLPIIFQSECETYSLCTRSFFFRHHELQNPLA